MEQEWLEYQKERCWTDARAGRNPDDKYVHPLDRDSNGNTIAMLLANARRIPPTEWQHNPLLHNYQNDTVAIILASKGIVPPKQWYHDPSLGGRYKMTVSMWLLQNYITPPRKWYHDNSIVDDMGDNIFFYFKHFKGKIDMFWQQRYRSEKVNEVYIKTINLFYNNMKTLKQMRQAIKTL